MSEQSTPAGQPPLAGRTGSAEAYDHHWEIVVKADSLHGAMDAVWEMWQAWQKGAEPISGICPACMGNRMMYDVRKIHPPNARALPPGGAKEGQQ